MPTAGAMTAERPLADCYEQLLTQQEQLLPAYLDALADARRLRHALAFLVAAACRTAGEYGIPVKAVSGPLSPSTAMVGTLLGTATFRALDLIADRRP